MDAILNGVTVLQATKSVKLGQVDVKLSFAVRDVEAFKLESEARGLKWWVFVCEHQRPGQEFGQHLEPCVSDGGYENSSLI
jgi:hypothetical protein